MKFRRYMVIASVCVCRSCVWRGDRCGGGMAGGRRVGVDRALLCRELLHAGGALGSREDDEDVAATAAAAAGGRNDGHRAPAAGAGADA
eukprot:6016362-Prymnesium_polylepis.1